MAKTEKKKNRRLRKRVRKTSAIVLLVTSIVVAAIPVPENTAAPTTARAGGSTIDADRYDYKKYTINYIYENNNLYDVINVEKKEKLCAVFRQNDSIKILTIFVLCLGSECAII